ncbi:MAG: hypothetical protein LBO69_00430 [Ignavibacteria bacterium]|jgi:hypothetical protein|nr:hypothetical protein [Ignavibacteria bacterium]
MKVKDILDTMPIRHTFYLILPAILVLYLLLGYGFYTFRDSYSHKQSQLKANVVAHSYADAMRRYFNRSYSMERNFNEIVSGYGNLYPTSRRKYLEQYGMGFLKQCSIYELQSVSVDFDKDALDGLDAQYSNEGIYTSTGRFNYIFYWENDKVNVQYYDNVETLSHDDFYYLSRKEGKATLIEPFIWNYADNGGKTGSSEIRRMILDFTSPVLDSSNRIVGVTCFEMSAPKMHKRLLSKFKGFDAENMMISLVSDKDIFIFHTDSNQIGKTLEDDSFFAEDVDNKIKSHKDMEFEATNYLGETYRVFSIPFTITGTSIHLTAVISFAGDITTTSGYSLISLIVTLTICYILTVVVVLFYSNRIMKRFADSEITTLADTPV